MFASNAVYFLAECITGTSWKAGQTSRRKRTQQAYERSRLCMKMGKRPIQCSKLFPGSNLGTFRISRPLGQLQLVHAMANRLFQ